MEKRERRTLEPRARGPDNAEAIAQPIAEQEHIIRRNWRRGAGRIAHPSEQGTCILNRAEYPVFT